MVGKDVRIPALAEHMARMARSLYCSRFHSDLHRTEAYPKTQYATHARDRQQRGLVCTSVTKQCCFLGVLCVHCEVRAGRMAGAIKLDSFT